MRFDDLADNMLAWWRKHAVAVAAGGVLALGFGGGFFIAGETEAAAARVPEARLVATAGHCKLYYIRHEHGMTVSMVYIATSDTNRTCTVAVP